MAVAGEEAGGKERRGTGRGVGALQGTVDSEQLVNNGNGMLLSCFES